MKITSANMNVMAGACMKAAKFLKRDFGEIEKLQVSVKGPADFVSAADKNVEKIIVKELQKARPDFSILSEEMGELKKNGVDARWILDPIDGTLNFLHGIPHFAISLALEVSSEIICAIIYDPIKDELFFAEKGMGAYMNNTRLRVSSRSSLKDSLIATGGPKSNSKSKEIIFKEYLKISNSVHAPIRKLGSAALDLAYVAAGRYEGFWQRDLNIWDVAAGILIVKEAGGFVTDYNGEKRYLENKRLLATNSLISNEMVNLLR